LKSAAGNISDSDSFAVGGGDPVEVSFKGWDPIPIGVAQRQLVQSPHFCDQLCQLTLQGSVCIAWKPNAQHSAQSVMRYGLAIEMPCARGLGNDPCGSKLCGDVGSQLGQQCFSYTNSSSSQPFVPKAPTGQWTVVSGQSGMRQALHNCRATAPARVALCACRESAYR
jgi:hypothetical protein